MGEFSRVCSVPGLTVSPRDMDSFPSDEERTEPHLVPVPVHASQPQLEGKLSISRGETVRGCRKMDLAEFAIFEMLPRVLDPVHASQPQLVQNVSFPVPMSVSARVADHFSDPGPASLK
jgi:hypothetical protein